MKPLRAALLAWAALTLAPHAATAQSLQAPSPYSLGYALPLGGSWALRSDLSPGLKWPGTEFQRPGSSTFDIQRASLYADWFPFVSSGFRVVGGLSFNDTPSSLPGYGQGMAPNQLRQKPLSGSTYLGIGYGQHDLRSKGLGFYADMGVMLGTLSTDLEPGANGSAALSQDGWRTQNNGWLGFRYLPSVSLGLVYRY